PAQPTVAGSYGVRTTNGVLPRETAERMRSEFGFAAITFYPPETGTTQFYHSFGRGSRRESFYAHADAWWSPKRVIYSMVVYLAPRAPRGSGTAVCRHKETGLWHDPTQIGRASVRERGESAVGS